MRPTLAAFLPALFLLPSVTCGASERLFVFPLEARAVALDSGVPTNALAREEHPDSDAESPAARVVRGFHPRFVEAFARAARGVKVVRPRADSLPADARYILRIDSLSFSLKARAVARRFVPPSPAGFDPATDEMSPGERRGRIEGPGWMNTLTTTAAWTLWDGAGDSAAARGTASGGATFRGDARRSDWEAAARALAKDVLRGTPFSSAP